MRRDLQYGFRQLRRRPVFGATVILLLAVGIGANTLVFSLVNELLLKPLPVRDPSNLYLLEEIQERQVRNDPSFRYGAFEEVIRKSNAFSAALAEQDQDWDATVPLETSGPIRLVMAQMVSPGYFSELGIRAILGRVLDDDDARASAAMPAVLSYQFWQSQFGGSRDVVGRTIRLKGYPFVVAGVLPRGFHSSDIDRAPDVRVPAAAARLLTGHDVTYIQEEPRITFHILVRLAPGSTPARAAAAILPGMRTFAERTLREENAHSANPVPAEKLQGEIDALNFRLALEPAGRGVSRLRDQFAGALGMLLGGVALLLLAVCANAAGLLLARADERRREIGIRAAIGAGRGQLVRQMLVEGLLLAVPGALLGAALAYALAPALVGLLPPARDYSHLVSPQLLTVTPDPRVLLFAAGLALFCVLAFGLLPAWRATRPAVTAEWRATARRGGRNAGAIAPVAVQAAFCVLLLAAALLMLRTFWKLDRLDPGFDRAHIVEFSFDANHSGHTPAQSAAFYSELKRRVEVLPGVRSAAYASLGVMRGTGMKTTVTPQGVAIPRRTFLNTSLNTVTPGYFETMGMPLLEGRGLAAGDAKQTLTPIVVNRAFADFFFPHQNPVGKRIVQGWDGNLPPGRLIVGLTTTAKYRSMREPDPPTFYEVRDERQALNYAPLLYVRTHGAPAALIGAVRQAAADLDRGVPLVEVETMEQEIQTSLWQERLVALLCAFFGAAACLLAAIGLYGALTYSVARRRRELGVRVAIGARTGHIVGTVCAPVAIAVGCGIAGGLLAAALLLRATERLLFGVRPLDPVSLTAAALATILCAALAAFGPAWRALRTDPCTALREE